MKGNRSILVLVAFVSLSGFRFDTAPQKVREGNRLFEKKEYEEALTRYRDAQASRPDAPEIPFNMGNSFYCRKDYKEAIASHQRSLEFSSALAPKAHYNIGNSLYREDDLKGALESYKKAIDLDPNDLDTKYNIELIQRKLKEQKQTPQSQQSQSQEEQQPQQKEEEKSSGNEQDKQNKEDQDQEKQNQKGEDAQQKSPSPSPSEISKKDAERLLNALQSGEKPLSRIQKAQAPRTPESPVEKDW